MDDSSLKGRCNCGRETFRNIKFGNASTFICNKCTVELANYLAELTELDCQPNDNV